MNVFSKKFFKQEAENETMNIPPNLYRLAVHGPIMLTVMCSCPQRHLLSQGTPW